MTAEEFILENLISMGGDNSSVVVEENVFEAIDLAEKQVAQQVHKMISDGATIDDLKQDSTLVDVANIIIQNTMAFVMQITALIMGVVFLLTLRLKDNKIKQ